MSTLPLISAIAVFFGSGSVRLNPAPSFQVESGELSGLMSATSEIIALGFLLSDTKEPRGDIGSRYVMKARFTNVCEADFELRRSCAVAERRYDQAETGDEEPGSREQELSITDRADKTEQLPAPLPTAAVMALLALAGLFFAGDGRRASK